MATIFDVYIANAIASLAGIDLIPIGQDPGGTEADGAIAFSDLLKQFGNLYNTATVTTGNVTLVEGEVIDLTISGMTADRDANLPTPSAAGVLCGLRIITAAPAAYELVVKANSIELTRLFISGESILYRSTGTGAGDWEIAEGGDGRIPCKAVISTDGAQNINDVSVTQLTFDTIDLNIGAIADLANDQIVFRRDGQYNVGGASKITSFTAAATRATLFVVTTPRTINSESPASLGSYVSHALSVFISGISAGDTALLNFYQNSGATQATADVRQLSVEELL